MSNASDIIKRAHASNVAAQFGNSNSYGGPIEAHHGNFRHILQMARKASANSGARVSIGQHLASTLMKPGSAAATTNTKRRAQIKHLCHVPQISGSRYHQLQQQAPLKRGSSQPRDHSSSGPQQGRKHQQPLILSRGRTRSVNKSLNTTFTTEAPAGNYSLAPSKKHSEHKSQERDLAGSIRTKTDKMSRNSKPEHASSRQALTFDQLKAIDKGHRSNQVSKSQKDVFDVVYQPQVTIVLGGKASKAENQQQPTSPEKVQGADESAVQMTERRRKSQPSVPPSAKKNTPANLDDFDLAVHKSVEYVYKSPSKMTSPEKKAFSQQLFAHDDKINKKVQKTLQAADRVNNETLMTILESKQVIQTMDEENRLFAESINRHKEITCNKQCEKYQNKPQRIVEPNLSKLRESRKQKALMAAQQPSHPLIHFLVPRQSQHQPIQQQQPLVMRQQSEALRFSAKDLSYAQMNTEPSLSHFAKVQQAQALTGLAKVNEESNYCTLDVMQSMNNGNVDLESALEKQRPSSTNKIVTDPKDILVTPMPIQNQVLSTKAAQAVLSRQLTMQLMPMYRVRQRSAGMKPGKMNPLNRDLKDNLLPTNEHKSIGQIQSKVQTQTQSQFQFQSQSQEQQQMHGSTGNVVKVSKPSTMRNSSVSQSLNVTGDDKQNSATQPSSNQNSKANTTQKTRSKSKKQGSAGKGGKWLSKEVAGHGGIRIRKVQFQGKGSSSQIATSLAQMSKSAQGKLGGFNLLTTAKDRKNQASAENSGMPLIKQQKAAVIMNDISNKNSASGKNEGKATPSVESPRILKSGMATPTSPMELLKHNLISHQQEMMMGDM